MGRGQGGGQRSWEPGLTHHPHRVSPRLTAHHLLWTQARLASLRGSATGKEARAARRPWTAGMEGGAASVHLLSVSELLSLGGWKWEGARIHLVAEAWHLALCPACPGQTPVCLLTVPRPHPCCGMLGALECSLVSDRDLGGVGSRAWSSVCSPFRVHGHMSVGRATRGASSTAGAGTSVDRERVGGEGPGSQP